MANILIVDDEKDIRNVVKEYCELYGYTTFEAEDGLQAIDLVAKQSIDCVILDVMMPGLDGYSTCRKLKEQYQMPIIMLSARQEEYDKLFGFELGVDDYVVKPFSPKELMARIKVVLERRKSAPLKVYTYQGLSVDVLGRSVSIDGQKASLTPKEIDLLLYLIEHEHVALSREQILEQVWNYDYFGDDRTVDTHIKMLRHNLGPYRDCIVTVRGVGYKFEA